MNWTLFASIAGVILPQVDTASLGIYHAVGTWIRPGYRGMALLTMALVAFAMASGKADLNRDWVPQLAKIALAAAVVTSAAYSDLIRRELLSIGNGLIQSIAAATGNQPAGTVPQTLDRALIDAMAAGVKIMETSAGFTPKGFAVAIFAVFYLLISATAWCIVFLVWLSASILASLIAGFLPIGLALAPFSWGRPIFSGFIGTLLAFGMLQAAVFALAGIVLFVQQQTAHSVLTAPTDSPHAATDGLVSLVEASALYIIFAIMMYWLPGLVSSIFSAGLGSIHALVGMGHKPMAAAGAAISSGAGRAAGALSGGSSRSSLSSARPAIPPGRPLGSFSRVHV